MEKCIVRAPICCLPAAIFHGVSCERRREEILSQTRGTRRFSPPGKSSAARDDLNDFEPVAGTDAARGELGRGDRFAIVLDHNAAREELLGKKKRFEGAGELRGDFATIGNDDIHYSVSAASQSFQTGSYPSR